MKLKPIIKNKRGQSAFDIVILMVILFLMICGFVLWKYVSHEIASKMTSIQSPVNSIINLTDATTKTVGQLDTGFNSLRYIALAIFIGMFLNILISNFLVKAHPVFFVFYIFMTLLGVILSIFISNAYSDVASNPTFASTFASFTEMNFIMLNLPIAITVIGFLGAVFLVVGIQRDEGLGGGI